MTLAWRQKTEANNNKLILKTRNLTTYFPNDRNDRNQPELVTSQFQFRSKPILKFGWPPVLMSGRSQGGGAGRKSQKPHQNSQGPLTSLAARVLSGIIFKVFKIAWTYGLYKCVGNGQLYNIRHRTNMDDHFP